MKQCFGYVRVSTKKQGEGVSLEAQKEAILHFAERNEIKVVRWFEEQQTAAKSGRPVFNSMLNALKRGGAQGVVMHRIDRSARNFFDWAKIGELSDAGFDVHFAAESLDFNSRGGRLTANIQMAVAEDYVRNLKIEIHKGQRGQLAKGYYPFTAPIGYLNNGKGKLKTPDPDRAPLIREAFELYASGNISIQALQQEMADRGLRSKNGKIVSMGIIAETLSNPFYAGTIRIRRTGEIYEGKHEPIVSPKMFERVQAIKEGRKHKTLTRHSYAFRGLFKCGSCGAAMIAELQKGHIYYRCHKPSCRGNCVREETLEAAIKPVVHQSSLSQDHIEKVVETVTGWMQRTAQNANLSSAEKDRKAVEQKLERLDDALIDGNIDAENHSRRKQVLTLEKIKLADSVRNAQEVAQKTDQLRRFLERIKNLAEHHDSAEGAEKREIVELATSNRTVTRKTVAVEPAKWLVAAREVQAVLSCAHSRDDSRTPTKVQQDHIKDVLHAPSIANKRN
ncbi:MAG: recombinase family protein [Pseudomonadota bacterium]